MKLKLALSARCGQFVEINDFQIKGDLLTLLVE